MSSAHVGTQLIIYGDLAGRDLAAILHEVAGAGYDGVETANLHAQRTPEQVHAAFETSGLALAGVHAGFGDVADAQALETYIQYLRAHGGRYLMCSGVSDPGSVDGYASSARVLNTVGKRCAGEGLVLCYHNHDFEFRDLDGQKGIHVLGEMTDPALVKFCIDVYWVHVGGEDPAAFIRRYANRGGYFHFKDGDIGSFTELGTGRVDLVGALAAARQIGTDWIVAEQDRTDKTPLESIAISRRYLQSQGI